MIKVAVVSPFPTISRVSPESGVAGYSFTLARHLPPSAAVDVIAQRSAELMTASPNLNILRSWRPGFLAANDITSSLAVIDVDLIHLQHEFRLFGGVVPTAAVIEALRFRRSVAVPVVVTLHGVIPVSEISKDFLRRSHVRGAPQLARLAVHAALRSIKKLSAITIVHNQYFKDVLVADYRFKESLISVIPPGVPNISERRRLSISAVDAVEIGSAKNVLVFGFLTSYKRPELVVDTAVAMKDELVRFTFCVSANPRTNSKAYLARYESLKNSVLALGEKATWSGFIPDDEVPQLFENADLLVLPYVDCVSVSAVASLAISHGVKICYSAPLSPIFPSSDLKFELSVASLAVAIKKGIELDGGVPERETGLISWNETAQRTLALWEANATRRRANR